MPRVFGGKGVFERVTHSRVLRWSLFIAILLGMTGCGPSTYLVPSKSAAGSSATARYQQAVNLRWKNVQVSLDRAINSEEVAIARQPNWSGARMRLATLFWAARQPGAALSEAELASTMSPNNSQYALWTGQMAYAMKNLSKASTYYHKALALNPGQWQAWDGLAQIALKGQKWTVAQNDAQKALLTGGGQGPTYDMFGRIARHLDQWQTAETFFQNAQAANPEWWRSYYDQALVDFHWGEVSSGLKALHSALNADPSQATVYQLLQSYPTVVH